jgi:hypothetical protein
MDLKVCCLLQEHSWGRSRQGHLRGLRLRELPAPQAVRQAVLLRLVRHPLEGGQEQVQRGSEGQVSFKRML